MADDDDPNVSSLQGEMGLVSAPCNTCSRVFADYVTCQAFPDGVPLFILTGLNHHVTEVEGDHGLQYVYGASLGPKPSWAP